MANDRGLSHEPMVFEVDKANRVVLTVREVKRPRGQEVWMAKGKYTVEANLVSIDSPIGDGTTTTGSTTTGWFACPATKYPGKRGRFAAVRITSPMAT